MKINHISHRGLITKYSKENSLKSFKKSFELGYSLETDLRYTKDEEIICFHDSNLRRIYSLDYFIKSLDFSKLDRLTRKKLKITKLDDLLSIYDDKKELFLELKGVFKKSVLLKLLNKTKDFKKITFISFYHKNLFNIKNISTQYKVGASFYKYSKNYILRIHNKLDLSCLILDKRFLDDQFIQSLKIKKHFYTIQEKEMFLKYEKRNSLIIDFISI